MGVDVILDQWDLRIGGDIALYMEHGLNNAALVMCVCSDEYVRKANLGIRGTGYEKMILTQAMMKDTNTDFIIPIMRNNKERETPVFLGRKLYIDFTEDDEYLDRLGELAARIYNEDIAQKPPLGASLYAKASASVADIKIALESTMYHAPMMQGMVSFCFSNNSGMFTIGNGEYEFITTWSECGYDCIYAYQDKVGQIGYLSRNSALPTVRKLVNFNYSSRVNKVYLGEVVVWINKFGNFAATKITNIRVKSRGAVEDYLELEYVIYH